MLDRNYDHDSEDSLLLELKYTSMKWVRSENESQIKQLYLERLQEIGQEFCLRQGLP